MKKIIIFLFAIFWTSVAVAAPISVEEGKEKIKQGALLVDVRTPDEFNAGHVENAINIPHDQVEKRLAEFGTDKNREIVLYCKSGRRAGIADTELQKLGFKNAYSAGGYRDWVQ